MAVLNNSYVVNGHFDFNPSKLSEAVGLRVYAKLKKPRGLFFRNPTLMGVYSENLQSGEIEFLFGVDTDQVPFIGRVRVMLLVEDLADGKWKVVEHPEAKTDYSILSKDIISSFGNRLRPTYDKSVWSDTTKLEDNRAKFYAWLDQRKTSYYEGFRANSGSDPRTWRTSVDADSQTNFNALKLALALEYWWFMRLGYVKPGIFPGTYMHTALDVSDFKPDTAGNIKTQNPPEGTIYQGLASLQNLISTSMYQLFQKARDLAVTNYNQRLAEVDSSIETVDPSDKLAYDGAFTGPTSGTGAGLSGIFNGTTYYTWAYNEADNKLGLKTDPITKLTVSGRDTDKNWMQYWQEYFLFADNEDDNDNPFRSYLSSESRYIGGIDKPDSFYFSNIMRFKRPNDLGSKTLEGVVNKSAELTYYKIRMRMNSPGVRYHVGVMLIHKQDIVATNKASELESDPVFQGLTQEEKDAIINKRDNLNSDIIFTPMISRPDTPDWLDEESTLLNIHNIADPDSISKFLGSNNHLEAEGINWGVSTDPDVSKFDLLFAIPNDVNRQLTYELKDVNLKMAKFYLQAPWVSPDNDIPLIELQSGKHSVTEAVTTNKSKYRILESDQGGTTNGPPTDDKNTCSIKACDIVLTDTFDYKTVTTVEKKNSQVRKFYIFHAEKTESIFRLQNEPIEITNRDWADTKSVGKFDASTKYVIRRFNNDVNTTTYTISFKRKYSVYDATGGSPVKSNTYYSSDNVNIYQKGATPSADKKITEPTILAKLSIKTEEDTEITTDYTWDGSSFYQASDHSIVTATSMQRGELSYAISGTVTDPDHNLPDLTVEKIPVTKYHVSQKTGVSSTYLDTYMISDEIRIADETFETALQRAYCIASIVPTGVEEFNYYVYSNIAGASGSTP